VAVFASVVLSGQSVSGAITLSAPDRPLWINIGSAALATWYLAFQPAPGAAFSRFIDNDSVVQSQALFSGFGGCWVFSDPPPCLTVRLEASTPVTSTTSFMLIETATR
jgi:hypothetical protein